MSSKESGVCGGEPGNCALIAPGAVAAMTGRDATPAR
jgi:hypothetical protein